MEVADGRSVYSPVKNLNCAAFSGTTDNLPWRTSGESANTELAFTSASVTGLAMALPTLIFTAGFFGSLGSTETTVAVPTALFFVSRVINDEPLAGLHLPQMLYSSRIRHAIPYRLFIALQVGERIGGGLGLQQIVHGCQSPFEYPHSTRQPWPGPTLRLVRGSPALALVPDAAGVLTCAVAIICAQREVSRMSTTTTEAPKKFRSYVPDNMEMKEFTFRAVLIGLVLTGILGAANAYLGLKAGMTIAATYPAAVIGMALLRLMKGTLAGRKHRPNHRLDRRVGGGGRGVHHSGICHGGPVDRA